MSISLMADHMCEWEGISPLRAVWLTWVNTGGDEMKQCFSTRSKIPAQSEDTHWYLG